MVPETYAIVLKGTGLPIGSVGVLKAIQNRLNKHDSDTIHVVIEEKETQGVGT